MSVIILIMLASLGVGLVFVGAFIWSVRSGQYEDTLTPSMRVLAEDAVQVHVRKGASSAAPILASEMNLETERRNGRADELTVKNQKL